MNELKDKVSTVFQKTFGLEQIDENASQKDVEKWDSLGHLNLVVAIEEEFDILFEPEEIAKMTSVKTVIDQVKNHLK